MRINVREAGPNTQLLEDSLNQACYILQVIFLFTEARITDDTVKFENIPYDDNAVLQDGTINKPCCQEQQQNKQDLCKYSTNEILQYVAIGVQNS